MSLTFVFPENNHQLFLLVWEVLSLIRFALLKTYGFCSYKEVIDCNSSFLGSKTANSSFSPFLGYRSLFSECRRKYYHFRQRVFFSCVREKVSWAVKDPSWSAGSEGRTQTSDPAFPCASGGSDIDFGKCILHTNILFISNTYKSYNTLLKEGTTQVLHSKNKSFST
jgi:hypothetical protein